jgi:CubicO group peptidase (beta-lactamase class C family)
MTRRFARYLTLGLIVMLALFNVGRPNHAQAFERASPVSLGFADDALQRVQDLMDEYTSSGQLAGISTLVARHGKIAAFDTSGFRDIAREKPMTENTIFRLHSMTKPLTSVAALMLYEEGRIGLDDPVSKYIPEFSDLRVYVRGKGDGIITEPMKRAITVRDVLTHQSGLSYSFFGPHTIHELYKQKGMGNPGEQKYNFTLAEMMTKLSEVPLLFQPGSTWRYSYSTDVVARVEEVAAGQPFADFMRERILTPLNMSDTDFYISDDKVDRLSASYQKGSDGLTLLDDPELSTYRNPPKWVGGGSGLAGSSLDYLTFCQMLMNGGTWEGIQLLKPETVALMTEDHLYREEGVNYISGAGFGFGLQMILEEGGRQIAGSKSELSWTGASNTYFWINPNKDMVIIIMAQFQPVRTSLFAGEIRQLIYDALLEAPGAE